MSGDTGYSCKECGASVAFADGLPVRSCGHDGTVLASMTATAHGEGGASVGSSARRMFDKVLRQIKALVP